MKKIFIDGKAGTTGLRIYERLGGRTDIEMITLPEAYRKDENARKDALNRADVAFLCLPDAAAKEAVAMVENPNTVVIDTSTAHRTLPEFAYGFPELSPKFEEKIKNSKRIAVPGCHASGFIALVYPLIEKGILSPSARLTCHSVTGYSGGGKKMIEEYEAEGRDLLLGAPRQYGLTQEHKHLKEMIAVTGLETAPIFCPIVSDFYSGMVVTVPLFKKEQSDEFFALAEKYLFPLGEEYAQRVDTLLVGYKKLFPKHLQNEADFFTRHLFFSLFAVLVKYWQRTGSIKMPSEDFHCDVLRNFD